MDSKTLRILEKTRQRRLELEADTMESPAILSSPVSSLSSATTPKSTDGGDSNVNLKKRKSFESEMNNGGFEILVSGNGDIAKKLSFGDASGNSTSTKPQRISFYPLEELEELAKNSIDSEIITSTTSAVTMVSPKSSAAGFGGFSKRDDSVKSKFAELATKYQEFEYQPPSHRSITTHGRQDSPMKQQFGQLTPSKLENKDADSGIETFFHAKSVEGPKYSVQSSMPSTAPKFPIAPPPPPPMTSTASKSTASTAGSKPVAKDQRPLGGLASLLVNGSSTTSSPVNMRSTVINKKGMMPGAKVASLANRLEGEFRTPAPVKAVAKVTTTKAPNKVVFTTVNRERIGSTSVSLPRPIADGKKENAVPRKTINAGVDTRSRPAVSKLASKFEKAIERGVPVNPDDSIASEHNSSMAVNAKPAVHNHASTQQRPAKKQSPPRLNLNINSATIMYDDDKPLDTSTPTESSAPVSITASIDRRNASPKEVPITIDGSSANSSALSDYLDDVIACAQRAAKTPERTTPEPIFVDQLPHASALLHTVSMYRRGISNNSNQSRPESVVVVPPISPAMTGSAKKQNKRGGDTPMKPANSPLTSAEYDARAKTLQDAILIEQEHVFQASRALEFCKKMTAFQGSREEVETNKALLIATERRRVFMEERQRLDQCYQKRLPYLPIPPLGMLTVNSMTMSFRREFLNEHNSGNEIYYFICLLKCRDTMQVSHMISSDEAVRKNQLTFTNYMQFHNLPSDFQILLEVYLLATNREHLSHAEKYGPTTGKTLTLGKRLGLFTSGSSFSPAQASPGGPNTVMDMSFKKAGYLHITLPSVNRRHFHLKHDDPSANFWPLDGTISLDIRCYAEACTEPECGFLHVYQEITGVGSWQRLWCVLDEVGKMKFWRYPEEEVHSKAPLFILDLKDSISERVGQAPIERTTRPHSFAFQCTDGTCCIFAADTKNDAVNWSNKLNKSLKNLRVWSMGGQ